jgi:uncharacterized membrane protein YhaH (DUF805 family)
MTDARYKIVFDGLTALEIPEETVKANLAQLFKCDLSRIEPLFNGQQNVLKHHLDEASANQYVQRLRKAGAMARMEQEPVEKPKSPASVVVPAALSLVEEPALDKPAAEQEAAAASQWGADFGEAVRPASYAAPQKPVTAQPTYESPNRQTGRRVMPEPTAYCELPLISLEGRLGRMRYMAWSMAWGLISMIAVLFLTVLPGLIFVPLGLIFGIIMLVASISLTVRRLHDMNKSGLWLLFVCVLGGALGYSAGRSPSTGPMMLAFLFQFLFLGFLCIKPGDSGTNDYDHPPPPNHAGVNLLGGIFIFCMAIYGVGSLTQIKKVSAMLAERRAAAENGTDVDAQMQEFERQLEAQIAQDPQLQRQMRENPGEMRRRIDEAKAQMRAELESRSQKR